MRPMGIGPRLDLRVGQSLVMTPQLRQAIKLLQFSNLEVAEFVEGELEKNPMLERDEGVAEPLSREEAFGLVPVIRDCADAARSEVPLGTADAPLDLDPRIHAEEHGPGDGPLGPPSGGGEGGFEGTDWSQTGRGGRSDWDDDERGIDGVAERPRSLREHLEEQIRLTFEGTRERFVALQFLAALDGAGRVAFDFALLAERLGMRQAEIEAIHVRLMRLDPTGLFARDLRECLAAQLAEKNRLDPAMAALLDNLALLARRDLASLMRVCAVDAEDLAEMIAEVRALDPKPAASWEHEAAPAVVPDVLLKRGPDGAWVVELNEASLPRLLVNRGFQARLSTKPLDREAKAYLQEQVASANWLVKSLQQRATTILKVAAEIVRQQDGFFARGVAHLRPLILRDIATAVEMHESTVSRVTANKYIATPRGTFELKYFFTTAIAGTNGGEAHSAEAVRHRIKALIEAESASNILSDDAIVAMLKEEGVDIARRTVAKYRESLRIPSSVQRRREKLAVA